MSLSNGRDWAQALIDLHCHLLPGIDDGSADMATSLAMARMAAVDGIEHIACTPHITPGVYDNNGTDIKRRIRALSVAFEQNNISIGLWAGADVHVAPGLVEQLNGGEVPTLGQSRYFLLEPPHHIVPPRLPALVRALLAAKYVPVITHPERLRWIESHYEIITRLVTLGALVQLTAGSIVGAFGQRPRYWSERMLDEGLVDIVASDAHNITGRPPILSGARQAVANRLGDGEAAEMFYNRPARMLRNEDIPARAKEISPQVAVRDGISPGWAKDFFKKFRGKR